ncbi:hypothetical protein D3C80_2195240 [compost metagenome]
MITVPRTGPAQRLERQACLVFYSIIIEERSCPYDGLEKRQDENLSPASPSFAYIAVNHLLARI